MMRRCFEFDWLLSTPTYKLFKTSTWNEYVFGSMSHLTYENRLFSQAKCYVLILFEYLIPLTCLNIWTIFVVKSLRLVTYSTKQTIKSDFSKTIIVI